MTAAHPSELFGPVIHSYTRAQAIEDGVLVDVSQSDAHRDASFVFPVAMTRTAWDKYVEVPDGVECQDEMGRLWDILWMLKCAIKSGPCGSIIRFGVHVRNDNRDRTPSLRQLKAVCGPGDDTEPVITIMLPNED